MGYSITIGELLIETYPEEAMECSGLRFSAKSEWHDSAPAYGEPTDFTNDRWPSYSAWFDFAERSGVRELLFDSGGNLIGGHPGVRLITKDMLDAVVAARLKMESNPHPPQPTMENYTAENGAYCRLLWLEYWMQWSLENCKTPVIANS